ncbi:MAG TPA: SBBP repeat-containing protein [Pyrinomonadaceae bacterium]|nr:SBBP repeat-containing protein [Pyrinomonadaceae bacterium]
MKSHPNVCAPRSRCILFAALILPLALLGAIDRPRAATNSPTARIIPLAIAGRTGPNGGGARLNLASHNLLGLTSGHASSGPQVHHDGGELLAADATLTWNTFLGGFSVFESAAALAVDSSGNIYVAGTGNSTWGAPVRAFSGDDDAFVAKLDANGNLIWNTFVGGSRSDLATALAVDGNGNIYLGGFSTATWGSPIRAFSGGYDAFSAKLDSGGHLIWNTFLGGPGINSGFDYGRALTVDAGGNIYVAGQSGATWGSPVRAYSNDDDAFVARLDTNGNLIWNTFLGGFGADEGFGLATDARGNVYVAGGSNAGWASPADAYSGYYDAYVAKLDSSGSLAWNTFLGSTAYDFGYALGLDPSGNVYVAGYSVATWGSPVRPFGGGNGDAFAAKLDPTGKPIWNTFLGGNALDFGFALGVDSGGNAFVAGRSDATWGSPIRAFGGGSDDGFAAKLDASGKLIWNAFLGGTSYDQANALAADGKGNVYVAGESEATWGSPVRAYTSGSDGFVAKIADPAPGQTIQFFSPTYSVNEGAPRLDITVSRTGDTSGIASVGFATNDTSGSQNCSVFNHVASQRCDYLNTTGTLTFAAGETSKSFSVSIVDDSYAEGDETFTVSLSNVSVAALGVPATATVTITDNDPANGPNPIDTASFFVRLHYLDFLNREPDQAGWDFWTNQLACGSDQQCIEVKRINVSGAFFLSIEFQETGYLDYRIYKAAYANIPNAPVPIRLSEFLPDTQEISHGVVVGQTGWEQVLESNKQVFTSEFVQRSRFSSAFPTSMTPGQFVDQLFTNAGVMPAPPDRNSAVAEFGLATTTADLAARARALRDVAENSTLKSQELNRAFVLMQYFGYLRRNPNDAPDSDFIGYNFWLTKLNQFNGNFVNAEMVKAFITSSEYRQRFGP